MEQERKTCKQRWAGEKNSTIRDLKKLWKLYQKDSEASDPDLGRFTEYGLAFDYVAPGTFKDQKEGYWRYQISYGGPSEEFRFYSSAPQFEPYRLTYVFMDWYDGHERALTGNDLALLLEIWNDFQETGTVEHVFNEATK